MISILAPSRSRPLKMANTLNKWFGNSNHTIKAYVSVDEDDPSLKEYHKLFLGHNDISLLINENRSAVDAINNAAKVATGDVLIVVSDDTDCEYGWSTALLKEVEGKTDWLLKTQDCIQDYICTMPVLDRTYYNRLVALHGGLYHPGFRHLFCDTYLTCQADILGKKLTSNLLFPHKHYSHSGGKEGPDELHKKNDATWSQGEELFIKLMKEFTPEERSRITDVSMRNWLRNKGVR